MEAQQTNENAVSHEKLGQLVEMFPDITGQTLRDLLESLENDVVAVVEMLTSGDSQQQQRTTAPPEETSANHVESVQQNPTISQETPHVFEEQNLPTFHANSRTMGSQTEDEPSLREEIATPAYSPQLQTENPRQVEICQEPVNLASQESTSTQQEQPEDEQLEELIFHDDNSQKQVQAPTTREQDASEIAHRLAFSLIDQQEQESTPGQPQIKGEEAWVVVEDGLGEDGFNDFNESLPSHKQGENNMSASMADSFIECDSELVQVDNKDRGHSLDDGEFHLMESPNQ